MANETIFADGLIVKEREGAPDFVICSQSYKVDEFIKFLQENEKNGWVNVDILRGKSGKPYAKLDTFEPKKKEDSPKKTVDLSAGFDEDDDPFA